jgi:hypothetical protein
VSSSAETLVAMARVQKSREIPARRSIMNIVFLSRQAIQRVGQLGAAIADASPGRALNSHQECIEVLRFYEVVSADGALTRVPFPHSSEDSLLEGVFPGVRDAGREGGQRNARDGLR